MCWKDYLFSGPEGTDAVELAVVLQVVRKAANPGSSAVARAQALLDQIKRAPDGAIQIQDTVPMAGQQAPYFVATYTTKDAWGTATRFAHTQIVLDHGAYDYLLSYSGPAPIYERHLPSFRHAIETLRLTAPSG